MTFKAKTPIPGHKRSRIDGIVRVCRAAMKWLCLDVQSRSGLIRQATQNLHHARSVATLASQRTDVVDLNNVRFAPLVPSAAYQPKRWRSHFLDDGWIQIPAGNREANHERNTVRKTAKHFAYE